MSVMKMLSFDCMMLFRRNWGMVVLMMHHVLDLVLRVIDQVAGWLVVVQMLMLSWIAPHRFAAVGVNLLVEVRMHIFSIDVMHWVVRIVMCNAVVIVVVAVMTMVVHWDALNLVVMVLVMVRV